jgi:ketosteroid isomerase-like protein
MKRSGVLLFTAAVAAASVGVCVRTSGGELPTAGVIQEISALEIAHNGAIARGDVSAVDNLTSNDFTFITPRGFLLSKREMLRGLSNGAFNYEYRQVYDLKIRVYAGTAVVTGRSVHTVQEKGKDCSDALRYTRVYAHEEGRWRAVAWQITREDREEPLKC